jgi:hypothetical protein
VSIPNTTKAFGPTDFRATWPQPNSDPKILLALGQSSPTAEVFCELWSPPGLFIAECLNIVFALDFETHASTYDTTLRCTPPAHSCGG